MGLEVVWNELKSDLDRKHGNTSLTSSSTSAFGGDINRMISSSGTSNGLKQSNRLSPRSLKNGGSISGISRNNGGIRGYDAFDNNNDNTMVIRDSQRVYEEQTDIIDNQRKEIDRLLTRSKEYETKIEQLKGLLREEKIKHDLAVQRLHHDYRLEMAKLEAGKYIPYT